MERALARARRPGPNFRLAVNKPQAQQAQFSEKLKAGSNSNFKDFNSKELGVEAGSLFIEISQTQAHTRSILKAQARKDAAGYTSTRNTL